MITVDPKLLHLKPGQRVLDLGCGEGRHAIHLMLTDAVDVFGIDLSIEDVKTASARAAPFAEAGEGCGRLQLGVGDALQLPFANDFFDVVICSEVLEHIPDYQGVLAEINRVLKPGGIFAATVPAYFPEWICWKLSSAYHQVEGGHIRIFREKQLRENIEQLGHQYFARHKAHALHAPYWWLKCLFWGQDDKPIISAYHRFLVWDLMEKPRLTRWLEKLLNPLLGKSIALYFVKPAQVKPAGEDEALTAVESNRREVAA
ncbi:class I SAM-dependent methyltransferase [Microbulbifer sp. CAU 1566]|uniref:class I SAM-dependent methyltransferase n=1 Tax=Microbulbifer sp. CAU 1566 TaxID=2933269 RepID=UPI002003AF61|nr:class I SAM-dependent methyltransferase [Microbulbifer sp. CAU 1566]MCK7597125.1 class I SAM-dependent methyltransferase [Microbulbifer sp. CAU 1566]